MCINILLGGLFFKILLCSYSTSLDKNGAPPPTFHKPPNEIKQREPATKAKGRLIWENQRC